VNREFGLLARDFVALGLLPPEAELSAAAPALSGVFQVHSTLRRIVCSL